MKDPAQLQKVFGAVNDEIAGDAVSDRDNDLLIQVTGTGTLTLVLEISLDGGTTYVAVQVRNQNSGADAASITAAGLFRATHSITGALKWRLRCSAFTSGTLTGYVQPSVK